ncbi:MAG: hypothetical protein RIT02_2037 [Planctomycetota bacterium]
MARCSVSCGTDRAGCWSGVTGVNELLSDVVADGVRGYGDLFESKSGEDVVDSDGTGEDDAECGVFDAEAADGIEHLCGDRDAFVAADAVEHPGDFIPEEHEFFGQSGFVEVGDGGVEQLFPGAALS